MRQTTEGWEYEADQRHAEHLIKALNMQDAKSVSAPQEEDKPWKAEEEAEMLNFEKAHEYRSLVARANYLAMDRSDIQNAVKEVCKTMAKPTVGCRRKLKRLARYLLGSPQGSLQVQIPRETGRDRWILGLRLGRLQKVREVNEWRGHHGGVPFGKELVGDTKEHHSELRRSRVDSSCENEY